VKGAARGTRRGCARDDAGLRPPSQGDPPHKEAFRQVKGADEAGRGLPRLTGYDPFYSNTCVYH